MQIELTDKQKRRIVLETLMGHLGNKDKELDYAVRVVLNRAYRLESLKHVTKQW